MLVKYLLLWYDVHFKCNCKQYKVPYWQDMAVTHLHPILRKVQTSDSCHSPKDITQLKKCHGKRNKNLICNYSRQGLGIWNFSQTSSSTAVQKTRNRMKDRRTDWGDTSRGLVTGMFWCVHIVSSVEIDKMSIALFSLLSNFCHFHHYHITVKKMEF
jgi:hypothetical protein